MDAAWVEREYNNRQRVPDHPAYFARWTRDSQFVRESLPCVLDLAYGPDPRHRIDLFPAERARGTLLFIHGGYWRSLDKQMFSWLASAWGAAGMNAAFINYRLAPAVTIEEIVQDAIAAANWLFAHGAGHGVAMERVVVAGHSAGGHLTAALLAAPREALAFDPARIVGAVPISGVYDFAPIKVFSSDFRLDDAAVARLDVTRRAPTIPAPLVIAAGAAESEEFQRQSRLLAHAWRPQVKSMLLLPGLDHFGIVDAFCERGQPLYEAALALFDQK
jgi:arylformamidase